MESTHLALLGLFVGSNVLFAESEKPTREQLSFFEKKIRPVLAESCYGCHSASADKIKGGLTLDTREGARRGGDSGAAVVPGNPEESLLIEAIRYENEDLAMPPKNKGGKLPEQVIRDFEEWIKMGAPDPRDNEAAPATARADYAEAKKWWAFQPISRPEVPAVKDITWARRDIDRFVLAKLEQKNLRPSTDADPAALLRRVYFDLIGLPPSPSELAAFERECIGGVSESALAKTLDKLLDSPQYGERWGRHWLDVARYAESTGKEINLSYPHAWRYRDYVIDSFTKDKPYDRFLREQLAGDLLPAKDDARRAEQLVATGFLAIGTKGLNERNSRQFALDVADEQIDTMSQAFLGMTVSCARCHDHKFDPIPQRDYYALAGIFLSTKTCYGSPSSPRNRYPSELLELPTTVNASILTQGMSAEERRLKEQELAELKADRGQGMRARGTELDEKERQQLNRERQRTQARIGELEEQLLSVNGSGQPKALAMGVKEREAGRERPRRPKDRIRQRVQERLRLPAEFSVINDSALYIRGDADKPGEKVPRGFPAALHSGSVPSISPSASGRRELADWMTLPEHPLTSRVMVNRVWHWVFGQGLVESVDNFGTSGQKPSHPELLDFLANRFREQGWSVKLLLKEILMSRAYRQASTHNEIAFSVDPENKLLWRMSPRRLDAECLRDSMLAISGELSLERPKGSLIASEDSRPIGGPRRRGLSEETILNAHGSYRSVYLPIARDVVPDVLGVFDYAENSVVAGAREQTNVPSQALYLLNSEQVASAAKKMAERVLASSPLQPERIHFAFRSALGRNPSGIETRMAEEFFARMPTVSPKDTRSAWTSFCRSLFGTVEFRYLN